MNSYYSNSLPPPPPNYYAPNYNHPPGPPPSNYNYNYPPPGPPGPPPNYNYTLPPPQNLYYHNHTNPPFPHPPSPQPQPPTQTIPPSTLTITTSPHDSSLTILTSDTTPHAAPQYTAKINTAQKPEITLSRPPSTAPLGTATMHTFSSTTDCSLSSSSPPTPFPIKYSSMSGNFTISHPIFGNLKWKANQLTGTSLELVDGSGSGHKIAKIKVVSGLSGLSGSKKGKGKKLEIYVPLSQGFLDLVVLSGLVAMVGTRGMMEAAGEVLGAFAGV